MGKVLLMVVGFIFTVVGSIALSILANVLPCPISVLIMLGMIPMLMIGLSPIFFWVLLPIWLGEKWVTEK